MPWFLLGWSPLAFGETSAHSQGSEALSLTEAISVATRSRPPRSGDSAAAWFTTAYLSGEYTRLYRSWPPYLAVVPPPPGVAADSLQLGPNKNKVIMDSEIIAK